MSREQMEDKGTYLLLSSEVAWKGPSRLGRAEGIHFQCRPFSRGFVIGEKLGIKPAPNQLANPKRQGSFFQLFIAYNSKVVVAHILSTEEQQAYSSSVAQSIKLDDSTHNISFRSERLEPLSFPLLPFCREAGLSELSARNGNRRPHRAEMHPGSPL